MSTFEARETKGRVALAMAWPGKIIAHISLARTVFYVNLLLPRRLKRWLVCVSCPHGEGTRRNRCPGLAMASQDWLPILDIHMPNPLTPHQDKCLHTPIWIIQFLLPLLSLSWLKMTIEAAAIVDRLTVCQAWWELTFLPCLQSSCNNPPCNENPSPYRWKQPLWGSGSVRGGLKATY